MVDRIRKRRRLTDVRLQLKTTDDLIPYEASRFKLSECSDFFLELFGSGHFGEAKTTTTTTAIPQTCTILTPEESTKPGEAREHLIVIPDDCVEETQALLDVLHATHGTDSSALYHTDFDFRLRFARMVEQFQVQHTQLDKWLAWSAETVEEALLFARTVPLLASRIVTMQGFLDQLSYRDFLKIETFDQFTRTCDAAELESHNRATLMLRWSFDHPDDDIELDMSELSGTYIRCILVPYALKYASVNKRFGKAIVEHVSDSNTEVMRGLAHDMAWGIAFKKTGKKREIDLEWMKLDAVTWRCANFHVSVRLRVDEEHVQKEVLPISFDVPFDEFSD